MFMLGVPYQIKFSTSGCTAPARRMDTKEPSPWMTLGIGFNGHARWRFYGAGPIRGATFRFEAEHHSMRSGGLQRRMAEGLVKFVLEGEDLVCYCLDANLNPTAKCNWTVIR